MDHDAQRKAFKLTKIANDPTVQFQANRKAKRQAEVPDPADVLNYKPGEYRFITEIHLSKKQMTAIHPNFQSFINLETVWLNDNKLANVENLLPPPQPHSVANAPRGCFRLKKLYLHNNHLTTLLGDIQKLKYLEILLLSNNRLSNMELVSQHLSHLRYLKQLDLFDNPLCEELQYREYFVHHHKSVILFDRRTVTDVEREEAKQLFAPVGKSVSKLGFGTHVVPGKEMVRVAPISASTAINESRAKAIQLKQSAQAQYDAAKEQNDHQERCEKRRLFHSLWGTKQGAYNDDMEDRTMSKLFQLEDQDSDVSKLIELAREQERTENEERKAELGRQIAEKKTVLFPSRLSDAYNDTLAAKQSQSFESDRRTYLLNRAVPNFVLPAEHKAFVRVYETGNVTVDDIGNMISLLDGMEGVVVPQVLQEAFRDWYHPKHESVALTRENTAAVLVELADAEALLASCIPLAQKRVDQHFASAQTLFAKHDTAASQQKLQAANALNDHIRLLKENAGSPHDKVVRLRQLTFKGRTGRDLTSTWQRHEEIANQKKTVVRKF